MDELRISVVIPFYNAREYVAQAVESAIEQPETGEVILVDDNSPDGGLIICQKLTEMYRKVKLLRHPDGKNHGAAATRNLGIKNAVFPYVAFLDADDFYLPKRFQMATEIFNTYKNVDGVYEAIGVTYENESVKELFTSLSFKEITTIHERVDPKDLFEKIIREQIGHFSFDGFTARKQAFEKAGFFSEELTIYEDTDLMYRLSAKTTLYPGSIDRPIAIRRVHDQNRITYHLADKRSSYMTYNSMWNCLSKWGKNNLSKNHQKMVLHRYITHIRKIDTFVDFSWKDYCQSRKKMFELGADFPELFIDRFFWRRIAPSREVFKTNGII